MYNVSIACLVVVLSFNVYQVLYFTLQTLSNATRIRTLARTTRRVKTTREASTVCVTVDSRPADLCVSVRLFP